MKHAQNVHFWHFLGITPKLLNRFQQTPPLYVKCTTETPPDGSKGI